MSRNIGLYMKKNPIVLDDSVAIVKALELMDKNRISHLLITSSNRLSGVLSKTDLLRKALNLLETSTGRTYSAIELNTRNIKEIMSQQVVTVRPTDSIELGIELLLQGKFHCVPVVDESGIPIGIITAADMLKGYYHEKG